MQIVENNKLGWFLITLAALAVLVAVAFQGPIPQDIGYHLFSDSQQIAGIPNFWNVISNLPFTLVGILGIHQLATDRLQVVTDLKIAYLLFFVAVSLVSIGSGYYHWRPDNQTLVWDRLPMTMAFMALFSIIVAEFVSVRVARALLWPLLLTGILSVVYWHYSEIRGDPLADSGQQGADIFERKRPA